MFRTISLIAVSLLVAPFTILAFNVDGPKTAYPLSPSIDLRALENIPVLTNGNRYFPLAMPKQHEAAVGNADSNTPMTELKTLLLDLQQHKFLMERTNLEENRSIVWDHVVDSVSSSTPCCVDYPFCGCPKLDSARASTPCCADYPFCGCPKL